MKYSLAFLLVVISVASAPRTREPFDFSMAPDWIKDKGPGDLEKLRAELKVKFLSTELCLGSAEPSMSNSDVKFAVFKLLEMDPSEMRIALIAAGINPSVSNTVMCSNKQYLAKYGAALSIYLNKPETSTS